MTQVETRQQVRRVLVITLVLNLAVAAGKIAVGLVTGALAITADGFHSLMDGASNVAGLTANHYAALPPDEDHPYGHRRFETLAALLIGGLLLLTAWEIAGSALDRLGGGSAPKLTPVAFGVMVATLLGNIAISRYQIRRGRALRSELLLADAANTSTDVFVTASVLVSMAVIVITGWAWIDLAAALVVVGLIARAAWGILRQTSAVLVDRAPYTPERLTGIVAALPAVEQVVRARSRGPVDAAHIDIDVQVAPAMTARQSEAITGEIRARLRESLGDVAEIEVHFVPQDEAHCYTSVVRAAGDALGLTTHEVRINDDNGHKTLDLHVEVPPQQTLDAAHAQASALESRLLDVLPEIAEVVTHIEPAQGEATSHRLSRMASEGLCAQARELLESAFPAVDWHHLRVYQNGQGAVLTLHAALAPQISIAAAHEIAEQAEAALRTHIPALSRVTIHTEPGR